MSYLKMDLKNKDKKYYLGIIGINIGIMMIIFIFILNEIYIHLINSYNVIHLINFFLRTILENGPSNKFI